MKRYTIFHAPLFSFFSADFYRAVAHRWRGIGFWYLLLLVVLTCLPGAVRLWIATSQLSSETLAPLTSQIPRIEIQNGEATVNARQPIFVTDPESGKTIFIIDTTGKTTSLDPYDNVLLLTKSKLIVKQPHQTQEMLLRDLAPLLGDPVVIDREWIEGTIFWWAKLISVLYLPIVALFAFLYRFVEMFLLAIVGIIIAASQKPSLSFAQVLRLSAMALTPVILLNTVYEQVVPAHRFWCVWWLICIAIPIGYLVFGIRAAREQPPAEGYWPAAGGADDDLDGGPISRP